MRIASGDITKYVPFVAVDPTDLKTRETGLSSFTVVRSRNSGADVTMTTPTVIEVDTTTMPGVYWLLLDEDTTIDSGDDEQEMVLHITHASMQPVTTSIELFRPKATAGRTISVESDGLAHADLKEMLGVGQSVTDLKDFADDGYDPSTNKVQGVVLADTVTTLTNLPSITANWLTAAGIADGAFTGAKFASGAFDAVWTVATRTLSSFGTLVSDIWSSVTRTITGFTTAAKDEIEAEVDDALGGGTGTALTSIPWNASWDTEVQSEVQDAIEVNHLDHLLAADYNPASKPGVATALLNELIESDGGVSRYTANALEQGPSGGGGGGATTSFSAAALAQLAGLQVNISPNLAGAFITPVVAGDDYVDADDRAYVITLSGITTDLTGFTAELYWERGDERHEWTATSVDEVGDDWQFTFERTAAQTDAMTVANDWGVQLVAISGSAKRYTLLRSRSGQVLSRFDE